MKETRQKERQRHRETERQRDRETERERERPIQRDILLLTAGHETCHPQTENLPYVALIIFDESPHPGYLAPCYHAATSYHVAPCYHVAMRDHSQ